MGRAAVREDVVKAQQKAAEKYAKKFDNPKSKPLRSPKRRLGGGHASGAKTLAINTMNPIAAAG